MKPDWSALAGFFWLVLLGAALLISAAGAYSKTRQIEEIPWGCDPFGYLSMAQEVRRAAERGDWPNYRIETRQNRLLIEHLKSQGVPQTAWGEMVAPHAHHYFPVSDQVCVQYPPGTGYCLALYPRGEAVQGLFATVIVVLVVVGLASLVVAGARRAWAAAGGVVFALTLGLEIVPGPSMASLSIGAVLIPLLCTVALVIQAYALRSVTGRWLLAAALAFAAGLAMGLAMLIRLPVLFLFPGAALLLVGGLAPPRTVVNSALVAFTLGFLLGGPVQVLAHQQAVAGAWNLSTYGPDDNAPPSLAVVEKNYSYYFEGGPGGEHNWALPIALVGFLALAAGTRSPVGAFRILLAAALIWGLSAAYFLTHKVTTGYYQVPAVFAAMVVLAIGGLARQAIRIAPSEAEAASCCSIGRIARLLALIVALLPGVVALEQAWKGRAVKLSERVVYKGMTFPAELTDERAWVFADHLSGPLWYYAGKTSYKVTFADDKTRALVCRFIFARDEPLYLLVDCESMNGVLKEVEGLGGLPEPKGSAEGKPYFLVRWPPTGPRGD
jgi:hypothetical protein